MVLGRAMECLEASMTDKSEAVNVLTLFMGKAPHALPVAYRGEDVAEKLGSKLVLINTSLLASPAHIRENCIRENCLQI